MAQHNELGRVGEELAAEFLRKNDYEILERNWFFQKAEVDIIAKKENMLAIIEVKTRTGTDFGLPQDCVKPKKIQLLVKAVNEYVIANDLDVTVRFDIIAITAPLLLPQSENTNANNFIIEHLEDAFFHF